MTTLKAKTISSISILLAIPIFALGWNTIMETAAIEIMTLDDSFPGGYQVYSTDIDGDGTQDVVGLGETVVWFRNPGWQKRPITPRETVKPIDLAPYDIDRDGQVDLAIASEFSMRHTGQGGVVEWFRRSENFNQPWEGVRIDSEPTSHRLRWIDVEGSGKKHLLNAPIMGPGSREPDYSQAGARLILYTIPKDPRQPNWPRQLLDTSLPVIHGVLVLDWDSDGREEILTASREGVHLFQFQGSGNSLTWTRMRLCRGDQDNDAPFKGSSEVTVGHVKSGLRFIATIEPWHGSKVVLYQADEKGQLWRRQVIDDSFEAGHALQVFDTDGNGSDEIFAGFRGSRHGVIQYRARDPEGSEWSKSILEEGGISCQGLARLDFGDGTQGLLGIGGETHNIKLYRFQEGDRPK